jgi:hypothetical protein
MTRRRLSTEELRSLRNAVRIEVVIKHLLALPHKIREGFLRFLCPLCSEFNTAVNPATNLGRCFRCQRNFNPIDLVIVVEQVSFLDAVDRLRPLLSAQQRRKQRSEGETMPTS